MVHKSSTETLITALEVLAAEIHSNDGIANAALAEAAERLQALDNLRYLIQDWLLDGDTTQETIVEYLENHDELTGL